ncbi:DnaD domain-containing protein [Bacillus albus]|uniref:DnaD domain-containing protein n=1 Tax=Bacillus albus TaxID=2026189 RepID=UPI001020B14A|nr:DnaD domain protein [Bacillus albus]
MSRLLLDDEPLVVLPKLATVIGLNEAIVLQQLHYWLEKSNNVKDDFRWIYNTYEEWKNQFPFWSESTIKRTLKKLQEQKIIIVGNYNKMKIDNTKWYRIDYELLDNIENESVSQNDQIASQIELTSGQNDQTKRSNWPDEQVKMTRPIPEITTEITTEKDNNDDKASPASEKLVDQEFKTSYHFLIQNGIALSEIARTELEEFCDKLGSQLVIEAVNRAIDENVPKWRYIRSILINWEKKQVKTIHDVAALDTQFEISKQYKKRMGTGQVKRKEVVPDWIHEKEESHTIPEEKTSTSTEEERKRLEHMLAKYKR